MLEPEKNRSTTSRANSRRINVQAIFSSLLIVLNLSSMAVPPAIAASNPMVHQQGIEIVDGSGTKLRLRAVNLSPWLSFDGSLLGGSMQSRQTHITESLERLIGKDAADKGMLALRQSLVTRDDIEQIASHHFNCVRVPVNHRMLSDERAPGWAMLDQLAKWCSEFHIYMIIDLHAAPGGQSDYAIADPDPPDLWKDKAKKDATVDLWRRIAEHFKNNPTVAGYDLLNEPVTNDPDAFVDMYKRIIKSIRSVDENHMLVVEGIRLGADTLNKRLEYGYDERPIVKDYMPLKRPLDRNMVYSPHIYTVGANRDKRLAVYSGVAHEQKVPMWIGEYGENTYEMLDSTLKLLSESDYIVGWSFWTWKRTASKYPSLNTIEVPAAWKTTMDWIANPFHKRPSREEAKQGLDDLAQAASIHNTTADTKLMEVLTKY